MSEQLRELMRMFAEMFADHWEYKCSAEEKGGEREIRITSAGQILYLFFSWIIYFQISGFAALAIALSLVVSKSWCEHLF